MEKKEIKEGVFSECLLMNIFPTGCPHGQVGGGGSAKCRQGEGGQKLLKKCGHPYGSLLNQISQHHHKEN